MSFRLNLDDLSRILGHIKVAERHVESGYTSLTDASGTPLNNLVPAGLRTVSGEYNNLVYPEYGSSDELMPRLLTPEFQGAEINPRTGQQTSYQQTSGSVYDSQPRTISNLVSDQTAGNMAVLVAAFTEAGSTDPYGDAAEFVSAYTTAKQEAADAAAQLQQLLATPAEGTEPPTPEAIAAAQTLADQKAAALEALPGDFGLQVDDHGAIVVPNVMPDLGDTAPFNSFFTLFGQFFDHGLDLVSKGGSGTVYIPLQPDDPLYVPGSPTNFMVLTRATNQPGADGIVGTADDIREHTNETTPFIDLNQVYTSHESHQVFLREYVRVDVNGEPRTIATGRMLEGRNGGPPTWLDIKTQAREMLGIELTDMDVLRVPLVATDLYGNFIPGADGYAQLVVPGPVVDGVQTLPVLLEGNADAPVSASSAIGAGRAFLNDIAHTAVPLSGLIDDDRNPQTAMVQAGADADDIAGNLILPNQFGIATTYDNELLDKHYVVGDGRGNENIGLTSVHHVFHSEHNNRIDQIKSEILASGDLDFINEWLLTPVAEVPGEGDALVWNGERLFQAGRFSTEMVYQHLVFEEFARLVSPDVDPFVFSNTVEIDPGIVAEFAHVVYRFGHSMLRETVDRLDADGQTSNDIGLIEAFLNPIAFAASGADADEAAGAILRGMSRQVGNEIDEFLTEALRNNLVGLPLDLGAINIARGRDTGIPSLNEARQQFYAQTNDSALKPYDSWYDFALAIKNPASIVNFIAAYGTHGTIAAATTLEAKRAAASALVFGGDTAPADRLDFLNATGAYAGGALGGLNNVDFWIGGLAEKKMAFGGLLGTTFNFVFEVQMEKLQEGDRFYYLSRTQGMNLLNQLEADSFAELVMRNTDLGDANATHLSGSLFLTPDHILELNKTLQKMPDPTHSDPILNAFQPLVLRKDTNGDGVADYLRYSGDAHVVLGGTERNDTLIAGEGDDTLWGDGGNDRLEGGFGVDHIFGGAGDDIITDSGTDSGAADVIHGDDGNDVINAGNGLDLIFGGKGQDFIFGGVDAKHITAGEGNDFVRGADGSNFILGNEGDDWLEGGDSLETLAGENSELFFNSPIIGHDVMNGRGNDTDYDGESGDDIMFQGFGIQRNNGMAGFDWAIHKGEGQGANSDLGIPIFVNQQEFILRDRFDLVEGLSGWIHGDILTGRDRVFGAIDPAGGGAIFGAEDPFESYSNALLETSVARISGFSELVAHLDRVTLTVAGEQHTAVVFDAAEIQLDENGVAIGLGETPADILLGGAGSDTLQGKAGNDILDGDRWLNVRIRINDADGQEIAWADDLGSRVYSPTGELMYGGKTLDRLMFEGAINPSRLGIVREILDGDLDDTGYDQAIYRGSWFEYEITMHEDGSVTVAHVAPAGLLDDGTDRLFNIEALVFSDFTVEVWNMAPDIVGTDDPDLLIGDARMDRIFGLGGNDQIFGMGGNDFLDGGDGDDLLDGGAGMDWLIGGAGNDTILGAEGNDLIDQTVGGGSDTIDGGSGVDTLSLAGTAADEVLAVSFDGVRLTTVDGSTVSNVEVVNADLLDGDDTLAYTGTTAAVAVNLLAGTASGFTSILGVENVVGGGGNDALTGDDGANVLDGGLGNDIVRGGAGGDTLTYRLGEGTDVLDGGADQDTLNVLGTAAANNVGVVFTGVPFVTVPGGSGSTILNVESLVLDLQGGIDTLSYAGTTLDVVVDLAGAASGFTSIAGIENVTTGSGNDTLISAAGVVNTLAGGAGNDTYVVHEAADRVFELAGGGTDEVLSLANTYSILNSGAERLTFVGTGNFTGTGSVVADVITSGSGNDVLAGLGGNDTIDAGAGDDTINYTIGHGADTVLGGAGNDTMNIVGTTAGDVLTAVIAGGVLTSVQGNTLDSVESVTVNLLGGTDTLTYAGATESVTVDLGAATATGFSSILGIENVVTGSGNDTLTSALGVVNTLTGGLGNDTYVVHETTDTVVEAAGGGTDEVRSLAASYTITSINIENLTYIGTASFTGTGNAANNVLTGGAGADVLSALGGNDTVDGGLGNDNIDAGIGNDTILYRVGDGADTINGNTGTDTVNVSGTTGANTLTVAIAGAVLTGIAGGTLTGIESVVADLGDGVDTLSYAGATTAVTVNLGAGTASGFTSIAGIENVTSGSGNDTLIGAAGVANTLAGGTGDDIYVVHDATDRVVEGAGGGTDEVRSLSNSYSILNSGAERLIFIGTGDFAGTGSVVADVITGGGGNDVLAGLGGNDTIDAGDGNDTINYTFGDGADTVNGGAGTDTMNLTGTAAGDVVTASISGGVLATVWGNTLSSVESVVLNLLGGTDTLTFAGATESVTVDLSGGTASGFASIAGIENVVGGNANDTLISASGVTNTLTGGLGNDTYVVHESTDTVVEAAAGGTDEVRSLAASYTITSINIENLTYIGAGSFTGTGNASANVLTGGSGADVLFALGGNDTLNGGAGNDTLSGGIGNDVFVFEAGFGLDTITDFDADAAGGGQDMLDLRGLGITAADFALRASVSVADVDGTGLLDTVVAIDGIEQITLLGVNGVGTNAITSADFFLAP